MLALTTSDGGQPQPDHTRHPAADAAAGFPAAARGPSGRRALRCVIEPGGCTAFRSHSNSNMLTPPGPAAGLLFDVIDRDGSGERHHSPCSSSRLAPQSTTTASASATSAAASASRTDSRSIARIGTTVHAANVDLHPDTMARITSGCGLNALLHHKMARITSGCAIKSGALDEVEGKEFIRVCGCDGLEPGERVRDEIAAHLY